MFVININKAKTILLYGVILLSIFLFISFLEFLLLKLFGFQYKSLLDVILFFILYLYVEIPLSIITDALPPAFKEMGLISPSNEWLSFLLDASLPFLLIAAIDAFMVNISIPLHGLLLFSLVSALISRLFKGKSGKPANFDLHAKK